MNAHLLRATSARPLNRHTWARLCAGAETVLLRSSALVIGRTSSGAVSTPESLNFEVPEDPGLQMHVNRRDAGFGVAFRTTRHDDLACDLLLVFADCLRVYSPLVVRSTRPRAEWQRRWDEQPLPHSRAELPLPEFTPFDQHVLAQLESA